MCREEYQAEKAELLEVFKDLAGHGERQVGSLRSHEIIRFRIADRGGERGVKRLDEFYITNLQ